MSGRSSTPPDARDGSASPPMSRPPPLENRWAVNRESVDPSGATGAVVGTASLTSPVSGGILGGSTPVRNAVVTHHLHKLSAAAVAARGSPFSSSSYPPRLHARGAAGDGVAVGDLGSARRRPADSSRPDWDFTAGEDTELQQIAGDIPPPLSQQPTTRPPVALMGPEVTATAAGSAGTSPVADKSSGPSTTVTARSIGTSPSENVAATTTTDTSTSLSSVVRPRGSSTSPLNQNSGSSSRVTSTVTRHSQSPNTHVRSSPYQSGSFLSTTASQPGNSPVNVVCRQRQLSPTGNLFHSTSHAPHHASGNGATSGNARTGGGSAAVWHPVQQQPLQRHFYSNNSSGSFHCDDGPFGPTTANMNVSTGSQPWSQQGLFAPVPRQGQGPYRDPQQQATGPANEVSDDPATANPAAPHPAHHHNPNAGQFMHDRQDNSSSSGGFVAGTQRASVTASGGAGRGHTQTATIAPITTTTTTTTTKNNSRSTLPPAAAHLQLQQQQQPQRAATMASAGASQPRQRPSTPPSSANAAGAGGEANASGAARVAVAATAVDAASAAQAMLAKPFTEKDRLAVLVEVQRNEQHLFYPSVRIPDASLNTGDTEANLRRLEQRRKQITYGKDTDGYRKYTKVVPHVALREYHNPLHPVTPRPENDCSKRAFDKHLNTWRRQLHLWDECDVTALAPEYRPRGVATLGDLGLAEPLRTPVPRPLSASSGLALPHHHHHHSNNMHSTMQSIASLATPGGAHGDGSATSLGGRGGGGGLRSPAGTAGGPIASFGSFRRESTSTTANHVNDSGNSGMGTPFNPRSSGSGGRPNSTTDCPTPNITFNPQRINSAIVSSSSGGGGNGGASPGGHNSSGVGANATTGRPLFIPTAASTPYRPQSADGPEVDSNFFNGSGVLSSSSTIGCGRGSSSRMHSPLGTSVPPSVEFGDKQSGGSSAGYPYQPQQQQQAYGNGSPFSRATPFAGNGQTPSHHRPSSGTLVDRTPTGAAYHVSCNGAGGGVMSRLLDFNFDIMNDSTRASPAGPAHGYNHSSGQNNGYGRYYLPKGHAPIPSQGSPYTRLDSGAGGGGGAALIPSTVIAPQQRPQLSQQPLARPSAVSAQSPPGRAGSAATVVAAVPTTPAPSSHATPPQSTQHQHGVASGGHGSGTKSRCSQPPEVQLTTTGHHRHQHHQHQHHQQQQQQ